MPHARSAWRTVRARVVRGAGSRSLLWACALCALVGLAVLDDYGVSADEPLQRRLAQNAWDYVVGREDRMTGAWDGMYGVAFELPLLAAEHLLGVQDSRHIHLLRHGLSHGFFLFGGGCGAWLAFRLCGRKRWALLALSLYLLHPRLYAHSFFNSKDVPFLSMFMVTLCLAHRACRRNTVSAFLLCGVGVGLLTNIRVGGLLLFAAVLGLRACDFAYAADRAARTRVLVTGGAFAVASALTLYGTFPYLWSDPARRFLVAVNFAAAFPGPPITNWFGGRALPTSDMPPAYIPVWFAITTPLLALLLGGLGAADALYRAGTRPGAILRNTPVRFDLLLLACCLAPPAIAVLLQSPLYNGWRQMYFLYAPFCLLAVRGLQALVAAWPRHRAWLYGLAGAGAGATLLAMAGLHPQQQTYFNGAAHGLAPRPLDLQYDLDYWAVSVREALEYLLARYPDQNLNVSGRGHILTLNRAILPRAERQRIACDPPRAEWQRIACDAARAEWQRTADDAARADFYIDVHPRRGQKNREIFAPVLLTRKTLHDLPLFVIIALDARWAPEADVYRATYRAVTAGAPVVRDRFDVYLDERAVSWVQAPCDPADTQPKFVLHVFPRDPRAAPAGFENLDFHFHQRGIRLDDRCLATAPLPAYPIRRLRVGQWVSQDDRWLWQAEIPVPPSPRVAQAYRTAYRTLAARTPAHRGAFDVYVTAETVAYVKEECAAADTQPKFILHVVPVAPRAWPRARRRVGFENRDFEFAWQGLRFDGVCLALARLPAYPIASLRVGQFRAGEAPLWLAEVPFAPPGDS